jgi:hypothetical protein
MTIISLNCWAGCRFSKLIEFIKQKAETTDVFCFQEMVFGGPGGFVTSYEAKSKLFEEIRTALPGYQGYAYPAPENARIGKEALPEGLTIGMAMFIKKDITVTEQGGIRLYGEDPFQGDLAGISTGSLQYVVVQKGTETFTVGSIHGLFLDRRVPSPSKYDTPERLEQSRRLVEFFGARQGKRVLCGDFNLRPQTESIAIVSKVMRNLIAEYGVTTTRNFEYAQMEEFKDYIADYAFVSPEVILKDFKVLPDIVSDHSALKIIIE